MHGPSHLAPPHDRPRGRHSPHPPHSSHSHHGPRRSTEAPPAPQPGSGSADVVRWAAFSCLLVPAVLIGYGGSVGGATVAAGGLAVVTVVCRLLLRQSERTAARDLAEDQAGTHRGRHSRTGSGAHRGGRKTDA
ncbi:hypothetical protein [Streptomyces sp. NPDC051561]|uniref:hypothetical protein n=1 Tax=Streptomyces sp. NPDC051561 TaxID=3365658 RepID=UPI0037BC692B